MGSAPINKAAKRSNPYSSVQDAEKCCEGGWGSRERSTPTGTCVILYELPSFLHLARRTRIMSLSRRSSDHNRCVVLQVSSEATSEVRQEVGVSDTVLAVLVSSYSSCEAGERHEAEPGQMMASLLKCFTHSPGVLEADGDRSKESL